MKPSLSLIIPAYEESRRLPTTLEKATRALAEITSEAEVIVVDDGSRDATAQVAASFEGEVPVRVVRFEANRGKGAAVSRGVREARHALVGFTDADCPYDLSALRPMLAAMSEGRADVAIGARDLAGSEINRGYGIARYVTGRSFSLLTWLAIGLPFRDSQCGLKAFRADVAKELFALRTIDGFGFDFEVLAAAVAAGHRVERFPVQLTHNDDSRIRLVADSAQMAADLLRVRRNFRRGAYERLASAAQAVPCPLCGEEEFSPRAANHGFRMVECLGCGLWYLNPMPTSETLSALYGATYYESDASLQEGYEDYEHGANDFRETFARRLSLVEPGRRILDVGAGFGYLLDAARGRFDERWGLEMSDTAASRIAPDHRRLVGSFDSADLPEGYFDVVSMQDCLEHLPDPRAALRRVRTLLRPGGTFLATTPNVGSWLRHVQGRNWVSLKFPEHVALYSEKTLRRVLEETGFQVEQMAPAGQYARVDFLVSRALRGYPAIGRGLSRAVRAVGGQGRRFYVPSGSITVAATSV